MALSFSFLEAFSQEGGPGSGRKPSGVSQKDNGQIKIKRPITPEQATSMLKDVGVILDKEQKNLAALKADPNTPKDKIFNATMRVNHAMSQHSRAISYAKSVKKAHESAPSPGDAKGGIITAPMWMFGGLESLAGDKGLANQAVQTPSEPVQITEPVLSAEEEIQKLIVENPDMNAATLWNTMKAKGLLVGKKEADSGSTATQVLKAHESFKSTVKFTESVATDSNVGVTKFKAVLIQEGLGNLKDGYYYTRQALEGAVGSGIFEGKKIYADHPTSIEEQTRPERSVRDIVGHFENVKLEENEAGQAMITADAVTLPDEAFNWARALMRHAVEFAGKYPDKDFVGLSINASGKAEPMEANKFMTEAQIPEGSKPKLLQAIKEGLQTIKIVSALDSAISCDLVTEAGAGGKVIQFLEGERMEKEKEIEEGGPGSGCHGDNCGRKGGGGSSGDNNAKSKKKKESGDNMESMNEEQPVEQHGDEEQDIALIKKMLGEYLGEEDVENEDAIKHAKESYEAYKEMGMQPEEAMKASGQVMKLAKHMAMKQKEAMPEQMPEEEKQPEGEEQAEECNDMKKESEEIIKLTGEITRLKEANRKFELAKMLDKKLEGLKESRRVTDKIRELIGEPKSEAHVDSVIKIFMGATEVKESNVTYNFNEALVLEKTVKPAVSKATGFGDCI